MGFSELDTYLDDFFQEYLALNPIMATYIGVHTWDNRFTNYFSYQHQADVKQLYHKYLDILDSYQCVSKHDTINLLSFRTYINYGLKSMELPFIKLPMTQLNNIFLDLVEMVVGDGLQPLSTPEDLDRFRERMREFSNSVPSLLARMREGGETGIVLPTEITSQIIDQLQLLDTTRPYVEASDSKHFQDTMDMYFIPNLKSCLQFIKEYYLPRSRDSLGLTHLPNHIGRDMYQYLVSSNTTRDNLGADEIHRIGLGEVERILDERETLRDTLPIADFEDHPKFYPKSRGAVLAMYRKVKKRINKEVLPKFFGKLRPKQDYTIKAVPKYREKYATGAYYQSPSLDGKRGGVFYVNLSNIKEHPTYSAEALCLHEGNPGHHFQLTLAQEYNIPHFRQFGGWTSFVEGWGLYSETLGSYRDKYSMMGRYEYELVRAVRLVIDTGIHHYGWDYPTSYQFMRKIFPKMETSEIKRVIYRYCAMPGQALAYKIGELALLELREKILKLEGDSQKTIQKFHRQILQLGPVPLDLLEKHLSDSSD